MKKVLVGFLFFASLLLTFQIMTVHGDVLIYKKKFDGIMYTIAELFEDRQEIITDFLMDQQDDRRSKVDKELTDSYGQASTSSTAEVMHYKGNYLAGINELMDRISLAEPYEELLEQKKRELDSRIEQDITDYLRQLLGEDNKQLIKLE